MLLIPKKIDNREILVRFLFDRNFKRKETIEDNLISKDLFLPNKGGVSLQRHLFCPENQCKLFVKNISGNRAFAGFFIFKKIDFNRVMEAYKQDRKTFRAEIKATPLDDNFDYYEVFPKITSQTNGNPSHADLVYIDPAVRDEESPNTAIRSFSRKLSKKCQLIIDAKPHENEYTGLKFDEILK